MTKIERGGVQRVAGAYDSTFTGTKSVSFPATPVWQEQKPILEVLLQNDPISTVNIVVGNASGSYVAITPGQSITVPINDLNDVWAGTLGGSATLNWIAMT